MDDINTDSLHMQKYYMDKIKKNINQIKKSQNINLLQNIHEGNFNLSKNYISKDFDESAHNSNVDENTFVSDKERSRKIGCDKEVRTEQDSLWKKNVIRTNHNWKGHSSDYGNYCSVNKNYAAKEYINQYNVPKTNTIKKYNMNDNMLSSGNSKYCKNKIITPSGICSSGNFASEIRSNFSEVGNNQCLYNTCFSNAKLVNYFGNNKMVNNIHYKKSLEDASIKYVNVVNKSACENENILGDGHDAKIDVNNNIPFSRFATNNSNLLFYNKNGRQKNDKGEMNYGQYRRNISNPHINNGICNKSGKCVTNAYTGHNINADYSKGEPNYQGMSHLWSHKNDMRNNSTNNNTFKTENENCVFTMEEMNNIIGINGSASSIRKISENALIPQGKKDNICFGKYRDGESDPVKSPMQTNPNILITNKMGEWFREPSKVQCEVRAQPQYDDLGHSSQRGNSLKRMFHNATDDKENSVKNAHLPTDKNLRNEKSENLPNRTTPFQNWLFPTNFGVSEKGNNYKSNIILQNLQQGIHEKGSSLRENVYVNESHNNTNICEAKRLVEKNALENNDCTLHSLQKEKNVKTDFPFRKSVKQQLIDKTINAQEPRNCLNFPFKNIMYCTSAKWSSKNELYEDWRKENCDIAKGKSVSAENSTLKEEGKDIFKCVNYHLPSRDKDKSNLDDRYSERIEEKGGFDFRFLDNNSFGRNKSMIEEKDKSSTQCRNINRNEHKFQNAEKGDSLGIKNNKHNDVIQYGTQSFDEPNVQQDAIRCMQVNDKRKLRDMDKGLCAIWGREMGINGKDRERLTSDKLIKRQKLPVDGEEECHKVKETNKSKEQLINQKITLLDSCNIHEFSHDYSSDTEPESKLVYIKDDHINKNEKRKLEKELELYFIKEGFLSTPSNSQQKHSENEKSANYFSRRMKHGSATHSDNTKSVNTEYSKIENYEVSSSSVDIFDDNEIKDVFDEVATNRSRINSFSTTRDVYDIMKRKALQNRGSSEKGYAGSVTPNKPNSGTSMKTFRASGCRRGSIRSDEDVCGDDDDDEQANVFGNGRNQVKKVPTIHYLFAKNRNLLFIDLLKFNRQREKVRVENRFQDKFERKFNLIMLPNSEKERNIIDKIIYCLDPSYVNSTKDEKVRWQEKLKYMQEKFLESILCVSYPNHLWNEETFQVYINSLNFNSLLDDTFIKYEKDLSIHLFHKEEEIFSDAGNIGEGGFGIVTKMKFLNYPQYYAIKKISKDHIIKSQAAGQAYLEAKYHSVLSHVNIIKMYGCMQDEEYIYHVLEFCSKGSIYSISKNFKKRIIPDELAYKYFCHVVNGLYYLNQMGIFHRDIKMENVLVDHMDNAKLSDFGLSAMILGTKSHSALCGTLVYFSPEITSGTGYDWRSDIWSLGVLLYEMLVGDVPFDGSKTQIVESIFSCNLRFPDFVNPLAVNLIKKALVVDVNKRIELCDISSDPWMQEMWKLTFQKGLMKNEPMNNYIKEEEKNFNFINTLLKTQCFVKSSLNASLNYLKNTNGSKFDNPTTSLGNANIDSLILETQQKLADFLQVDDIYMNEENTSSSDIVSSIESEFYPSHLYDSSVNTTYEGIMESLTKENKEKQDDNWNTMYLHENHKDKSDVLTNNWMDSSKGIENVNVQKNKLGEQERIMKAEKESSKGKKESNLDERDKVDRSTQNIHFNNTLYGDIHLEEETTVNTKKESIYLDINQDRKEPQKKKERTIFKEISSYDYFVEEKNEMDLKQLERGKEHTNGTKCGENELEGKVRDYESVFIPPDEKSPDERKQKIVYSNEDDIYPENGIKEDKVHKILYPIVNVDLEMSKKGSEVMENNYSVLSINVRSESPFGKFYMQKNSSTSDLPPFADMLEVNSELPLGVIKGERSENTFKEKRGRKVTSVMKGMIEKKAQNEQNGERENSIKIINCSQESKTNEASRDTYDNVCASNYEEEYPEIDKSYIPISVFKENKTELENEHSIPKINLEVKDEKLLSETKKGENCESIEWEKTAAVRKHSMETVNSKTPHVGKWTRGDSENSCSFDESTGRSSVGGSGIGCKGDMVHIYSKELVGKRERAKCEEEEEPKEMGVRNLEKYEGNSEKTLSSDRKGMNAYEEQMKEALLGKQAEKIYEKMQARNCKKMELCVTATDNHNGSTSEENECTTERAEDSNEEIVFTQEGERNDIFSLGRGSLYDKYIDKINKLYLNIKNKKLLYDIENKKCVGREHDHILTRKNATHGKKNENVKEKEKVDAKASKEAKEDCTGYRDIGSGSVRFAYRAKKANGKTTPLSVCKGIRNLQRDNAYGEDVTYTTTSSSESCGSKLDRKMEILRNKGTTRVRKNNFTDLYDKKFLDDKLANIERNMPNEQYSFTHKDKKEKTFSELKKNIVNNIISNTKMRVTPDFISLEKYNYPSSNSNNGDSIIKENDKKDVCNMSEKSNKKWHYMEDNMLSSPHSDYSSERCSYGGEKGKSVINISNNTLLRQKGEDITDLDNGTPTCEPIMGEVMEETPEDGENNLHTNGGYELAKMSSHAANGRKENEISQRSYDFIANDLRQNDCSAKKLHKHNSLNSLKSCTSFNSLGSPGFNNKVTFMTLENYNNVGDVFTNDGNSEDRISKGSTLLMSKKIISHDASILDGISKMKRNGLIRNSSRDVYNKSGSTWSKRGFKKTGPADNSKDTYAKSNKRQLDRDLSETIFGEQTNRKNSMTELSNTCKKSLYRISSNEEVFNTKKGYYERNGSKNNPSFVCKRKSSLKSKLNEKIFLSKKDSDEKKGRKSQIGRPSCSRAESSKSCDHAARKATCSSLSSGGIPANSESKNGIKIREVERGLTPEKEERESTLRVQKKYGSYMCKEGDNNKLSNVISNKSSSSVILSKDKIGVHHINVEKNKESRNEREKKGLMVPLRSTKSYVERGKTNLHVQGSKCFLLGKNRNNKEDVAGNDLMKRNFKGKISNDIEMKNQVDMEKDETLLSNGNTSYSTINSIDTLIDAQHNSPSEDRTKNCVNPFQNSKQMIFANNLKNSKIKQYLKRKIEKIKKENEYTTIVGVKTESPPGVQKNDGGPLITELNDKELDSHLDYAKYILRGNSKENVNIDEGKRLMNDTEFNARIKHYNKSQNDFKMRRNASTANVLTGEENFDEEEYSFRQKKTDELLQRSRSEAVKKFSFSPVRCNPLCSPNFREKTKKRELNNKIQIIEEKGHKLNEERKAEKDKAKHISVSYNKYARKNSDMSKINRMSPNIYLHKKIDVSTVKSRIDTNMFKRQKGAEVAGAVVGAEKGVAMGEKDACRNVESVINTDLVICRERGQSAKMLNESSTILRHKGMHPISNSSITGNNKMKKQNNSLSNSSNCKDKLVITCKRKFSDQVDGKIVKSMHVSTTEKHNKELLSKNALYKRAEKSTITKDYDVELQNKLLYLNKKNVHKKSGNLEDGGEVNQGNARGRFDSKGRSKEHSGKDGNADTHAPAKKSVSIYKGNNLKRKVSYTSDLLCGSPNYFSNKDEIKGENGRRYGEPPYLDCTGNTCLIGHSGRYAMQIQQGCNVKEEEIQGSANTCDLFDENEISVIEGHIMNNVSFSKLDCSISSSDAEGYQHAIRRECATERGETEEKTDSIKSNNVDKRMKNGLRRDYKPNEFTDLGRLNVVGVEKNSPKIASSNTIYLYGKKKIDAKNVSNSKMYIDVYTNCHIKDDNRDITGKCKYNYEQEIQKGVKIGEKRQVSARKNLFPCSSLSLLHREGTKGNDKKSAVGGAFFGTPDVDSANKSCIVNGLREVKKVKSSRGIQKINELGMSFCRKSAIQKQGSMKKTLPSSNFPYCDEKPCDALNPVRFATGYGSMQSEQNAITIGRNGTSCIQPKSEERSNNRLFTDSHVKNCFQSKNRVGSLKRGDVVTKASSNGFINDNVRKMNNSNLQNKDDHLRSDTSVCFLYKNYSKKGQIRNNNGPSHYSSIGKCTEKKAHSAYAKMVSRKVSNMSTITLGRNKGHSDKLFCSDDREESALMKKVNNVNSISGVSSVKSIHGLSSIRNNNVDLGKIKIAVNKPANQIFVSR
ncbi:serine/threonine protein kinase, putative (ARK3) [Plasmodium ovale curtisi]|uniref:Serine/threonine protein kinase, putative (ARK3) n=1 Tax=Plasmodium ovale curtisi TaxID=864141 RepID=A0A1A8W092_PLAOA|nr:serine/threonine protein kinase, putative (ARK3) [Plasmodium ovale curtisi]